MKKRYGCAYKWCSTAVEVLIQLLLGKDIAAALLLRVVSKCDIVMMKTRRLTSHWNETIVEKRLLFIGDVTG